MGDIKSNSKFNEDQTALLKEALIESLKNNNGSKKVIQLNGKSSLLFANLTALTLASCGGGGGEDISSAENISLNPIINFLRVNNSTINSGSYITLSWQSIMAVSCTATGDWDGIKTVTGTESLQLNEVRTHTFVLICDGEADQKSSPLTVSVIVTPVQTNIYSEDKDSYCASPSNNN